MSLPLAIAVYWICWWLVLLVILPLGIRTQQEVGEIVPGTSESAPAVPHILMRLLATTAVAAVLFAVVYAVMAYDLVTLENFPFLPDYENLSSAPPHDAG